MANRLSACCAAATAIMASWAAPAFAQNSFTVSPVSDTMLGTIRAGFQPTVPQIVRLQDDFARSDFRLFGSAGGIAMDNWWAQDGASLIATSIVSQR